MTPPLIHRDMKPENVMLLPDGATIRLIDFGTAREMGHGAKDRGVAKTKVYTEGYAPPEQIIGKPEPRSDLFALAGTLYHLATGQAPEGFFTGRELAKKLSRLPGGRALVLRADRDQPVRGRERPLPDGPRHEGRPGAGVGDARDLLPEVRDGDAGPRAVLPRVRGADGPARPAVPQVRPADAARQPVLRHLRGPAVTAHPAQPARPTGSDGRPVAPFSHRRPAYDMPGPVAAAHADPVNDPPTPTADPVPPGRRRPTAPAVPRSAGPRGRRRPSTAATAGSSSPPSRRRRPGGRSRPA